MNYYEWQQSIQLSASSVKKGADVTITAVKGVKYSILSLLFIAVSFEVGTFTAITLR